MKLGVLLLCSWMAFGAGAWELTVAFTNDLHAYAERLEVFGPLFAEADLILDAGDTWEDTYRRTGPAEAWATLHAMAELGYHAMVLGNHETYLGPQVLHELVASAPFPVLATNLRSPLPTRRYALLDVGGVRVLVLGVLYDLVIVWPGWELLDPLKSVQDALAQAPEHDLFILLGHMELARARALAQSLPECALLILGHNHHFLDEPVWEGKVPIVQAGHRGQAVGVVRLESGKLASYKLVRQPVGVELLPPAARGSF